MDIVHKIKNSFLDAVLYVLTRPAFQRVSRIIMLSALFVFVVTISSFEIADLDFWFHLKCGEVMVQQKAFIFNDIFSFTRFGQPWINHEWLFQIVLYAFHQFFGVEGLVIFKIAVFVLIYALLFLFFERRYHFLASGLLTACAYFCAIQRSIPRPDILSLLLFTVVLLILSSHQRKWFWSLPVLQLFWINIHGFFFIGFIMMFCYWLHTFLRVPDAVRRNRPVVAAVFCVSVLVSFLNPNTYEGVWYPVQRFWELSSGKESGVFMIIEELRNPFTTAQGLSVDAFRWLFYATVLSFLLNRKKFNTFYCMVVICIMFFSGRAVRNIPFFGIIGAIAVGDNLFSLWLSASWRERVRKLFTVIVANLAVVVSVCLFVAFLYQEIKPKIEHTYVYFDQNEKAQVKNIFWGYAQRKYPWKMLEFIKTVPLPERMFNDFNLGSYLIGNLYPRRKVFIDGRTEFYGSYFMNTYIQATDGDEVSLRELISDYALDGFMIDYMNDVSYPLIQYLHAHEDTWFCIYFDFDGIIFIRNAPAYQEVIERYKIDFNRWESAAPASRAYAQLHPVIPYNYIKRAEVLYRLGYYSQALREIERAAKVYPTIPQIFLLRGKVYYRMNQLDDAFWQLRYCAFIDRLDEEGSSFMQVLEKRQTAPAVK